jgi:hypothetical protein
MRVAAAGVMPIELCGEDDSGYSGPTGMAASPSWCQYRPAR